MDVRFVAALVIAFLLGSIPFAQIIAKLVAGVDLRKVGSLNVGARNLTATVGPAWGLVAGFLDFLKGVASILLAKAVGVTFPAFLLGGAAAVVGHNWPVWLRFKGGKGLATALGVLAPLAFYEALAAFGVWIFVIRIWGNVIAASAAAVATLLALLAWLGYPAEISFLVIGLVILVLLSALPDMLERGRTTGSILNYLLDPELLRSKPKTK